MINRPLSALGSDTVSDSAEWNADRNPQVRLIVLWLTILLPTAAIAGRMAHLQLSLRDDLAAAFSQNMESLEEIPARDGRILAADGSVLAGDTESYDVAVYYPAIQTPPDDAWIKEKARPRLRKSDYKNKDKLAAEKQKVIEENEFLWQRLADLSGRPLNELTDARQRVQARVERIKADVQRRYRERHASSSSTAHADDAATEVWPAFWGHLGKLFAEPAEERRGPRSIREEEDYHTVITNVDEETKKEIEGHPALYPYTRIVVQSRRTYPKGELASHIIGFRKPISEEGLQTRRVAFPEGDPLEYHLGDPCGMSGLELQYDSQLRGVRGKVAIVRNRRREIIETRVVRQPRHGRDLVLALDADVQQEAERLLDQAMQKVTRAGTIDLESTLGKFPEVTCPQGGCIVAIDVHTGAVLAAAAAPRFDLNLMVAPDSTDWEAVMSDPRSPFLSRTTQMALPPGSVFKIISAVASIESGKMPPDTSFYCQGYLDSPRSHRCLTYRHQHVGHSDVKLTDALCRSCNVYFYTAARRMGPQTLVDWARKFGIGLPTGIDLPSESAGHLPSPDAPNEPGNGRPKWRKGDTLDLAIGQSSLTVTPFQMVRAVAAVANGGNLIVPRLAADSGPAILDESGSMRRSQFGPDSHPIEGLHSRTLDYVREGMEMVVYHPRGTGYKTVRMKEVTIAGKTGTAETNGVDHAWFAGYVPADRPRIAFIVVLQNGGGGGTAAGPVAHDFVKTLVDMGLVSKTAELAGDEPSQRR
jgi:penicillin-binding protein 2